MQIHNSYTSKFKFKTPMPEFKKDLRYFLQKRKDPTPYLFCRY